jgi:hypothetical protein
MNREQKKYKRKKGENIGEQQRDEDNTIRSM